LESFIIKCPTTAQVLFILDDNGQGYKTGVRRGDHLLSLESCKTEMPIYCPEQAGDGVWFCIFLVEPGLVVGQGQGLCKLERTSKAVGPVGEAGEAETVE
jgi:hypothetical protein